MPSETFVSDGPRADTPSGPARPSSSPGTAPYRLTGEYPEIPTLPKSRVVTLTL
jgi:hypothetical protein